VITLDLEDLRGHFGFGVAGNFAGHLEQAGEAPDFASVDAPPDAPKGIFPFYVPAAAPDVPAFLNTFPLSATEIALPAGAENLQIEPELGLLVRVRYAADGRVSAVVPHTVAAFNDCSIRTPAAAKISQKKNWGPASKGLAATGWHVGGLTPGAGTDTLRLASFLRRGRELHAYGLDSAVSDYSYYGDTLLSWICQRLGDQTGAAGTPLEPVGAYLAAAGSPAGGVIGIGATRYTPYGERTYLEPGDLSIVVLYDGSVHRPAEISAAAAAGRTGELAAASVLTQRVVAV
jgi:hypothetical protein